MLGHFEGMFVRPDCVCSSGCLFLRAFVINYNFFVYGSILTKMGLFSLSDHKESIGMLTFQIRPEMRE